MKRLVSLKWIQNNFKKKKKSKKSIDNHTVNINTTDTSEIDTPLTAT